jgi:hypothetical protein
VELASDTNQSSRMDFRIKIARWLAILNQCCFEIPANSFFDSIGQQPILAVNEKVRTILNCSLNQSILSRYFSTMEGAQLVIVNSVNV